MMELTLKKTKRYKFEYMHEVGPRWFVLGTGINSLASAWWYYIQAPDAMAKYSNLAKSTDDNILQFWYYAAYWSFVVCSVIGTIAYYYAALILRIVIFFL